MILNLWATCFFLRDVPTYARKYLERSTLDTQLC
jgi:hypothetical protein